MGERPILFSTPMVRALLAGTKTQTRRVVKPKPGWFSEVGHTRVDGPFVWPIGSLGQQCGAPLTRFPYGHVGDHLYVRETFHFDVAYDRLKPREVNERAAIWYDADGRLVGNGIRGKTRVSIHMPRWASRITLRVTDVRVERLNDISHRDACAEGLISKPHHWHDPDGPLNDVGYLAWEGAPDIYSDAADAYRALWEHINGPGSWAANPWVWAVSFERLP